MNVEEIKRSNKHNWKLKVGILGISLFLQVAGSFNRKIISKSIINFNSGIIHFTIFYYHAIYII